MKSTTFTICRGGRITPPRATHQQIPRGRVDFPGSRSLFPSGPGGNTSEVSCTRHPRGATVPAAIPALQGRDNREGPPMIGFRAQTPEERAEYLRTRGASRLGEDLAPPTKADPLADCKADTAAARRYLEAGDDRPRCECHGEPKLWAKRGAGGSWYCAVRPHVSKVTSPEGIPFRVVADVA